jgi:Raf kinase inhibitor-like YbhB/YbcL family protein
MIPIESRFAAARRHFSIEEAYDTMRLLSSAIQDGEPIPPRFTCEGENISPEFYGADAPKETKSFVLILHDPDAPRDNAFTHWLLYDIPPNVTRIREDLPKQAPVADSGLQGKNDSGKLGYTGPRPPSGRHRYFALLYALRKQIGLPPGATAMEVKMALEGKVIEQTELMRTFTRAIVQRSSRSAKNSRPTDRTISALGGRSHNSHI